MSHLKGDEPVSFYSFLVFHDFVNHVLHIRVSVRLHVPRECINTISHVTYWLPAEVVWSHQPVTSVIVDVIRPAKYVLQKVLCLLELKIKAKHKAL